MKHAQIQPSERMQLLEAAQRVFRVAEDLGDMRTPLRRGGRVVEALACEALMLTLGSIGKQMQDVGRPTAPPREVGAGEHPAACAASPAPSLSHTLTFNGDASLADAEAVANAFLGEPPAAIADGGEPR